MDAEGSAEHRCAGRIARDLVSMGGIPRRRDRYENYKRMSEARHSAREHSHVGHADIYDLKRFAAAVDAARLVPIHTFLPERFTELFQNVAHTEDGIWQGV